MEITVNRTMINPPSEAKSIGIDIFLETILAFEGANDIVLEPVVGTSYSSIKRIYL